MRKLLIIILVLVLMHTVYAQYVNKKYFAVRVENAPKIDGVLDEEVWSKVKATDEFTQFRPIEGSKPTYRSEIKIVYNNNAIYVAAMLYDESPNKILHELGNRDDGNLNADFFRFVIDPYNTRQDAFDFGVYASGVQVDSKFSDGTYDGVWQSATKINDKGWVVEMKIPYSAIRFPQKNVQEWGLQFIRTIRRSRETDQWALTPSGVGNPQKYWGTLQGVTEIKTPIRLSLTPYISVYTERRPAYNENGTYSYGNSLSYSGGADIKYGIDDRFTLDMTLFPDFSQVQSDKKVKNLSYNEVTYDENRQFFKEGTDLFSKFGLFYSRRIGRVPSGHNTLSSQLAAGEVIDDNPAQVKLLNATKVSGRTDGGLGIGILNAVTDNTYATVKDSLGHSRKILTEPLTNYNVFVFDQQLANNSSIFVINTNVLREKKYNDANVTASGITLNNKSNTYAIDAIGAFSQKII
jgi:hypothetical protein